MSENTIKKLKLKRRHPRKAMRLGRHIVTNIFQEFELNEAEQKELETEGGRAWMMTPVQEEVVKKEKIEEAKKEGKKGNKKKNK